MAKTELTIWRDISIYKDKGPKAKLSINCCHVEFPSSDRPLLDKICFKDLRINYINYSVIAFLRPNKRLLDKGVNLHLHLNSSKGNIVPIWRVFAREILPIFTTTNIRLLYIENGDHLDNLRREISSTILSDLNLSAIFSLRLFPDVIANDGPNPTATQTLAKWLHIPDTNLELKQLFCGIIRDGEWVKNFKKAFPRANTSVSYNIHFASPPIDHLNWSMNEPMKN